MKKILFLLPAASLMVGCSTFGITDLVDEQVAANSYQSQNEMSSFRTKLTDSNRIYGQSVDLPWIAGHAQPLARDASLPIALQSRVNTTLLFSEGATDLVGLANRIQKATGILVEVKPEALLPIQNFLPRIKVEDSGMLLQQPEQADTLIPSISLLLSDAGAGRDSGPYVGGAQKGTLSSVSLKGGQAPLSRVLDAISLRLGVYWKYDPAITGIIFYRTETRAFKLKTEDGVYQADLDLGLSSSGGGSSTSGGGQFRSSSRTSFTLNDVNPTQEISKKIAQFMTVAGKLEQSGGSNSLVITDTKDALDAIQKFVDEENKALTRKVRLLFEEVTIQHTDTGQSGIDWSAIYQSAGRATSASLAGMSAGVAQATGVFSATREVGRWQGSGVSIKALSEIGRILRKNSIPLLLTNKRPGTYAARESFHFINEMEQTQSTSESSEPTVTAKQKEETVGTFLTVIPDADDNGQISLSINYNDSRLIDLTKETLSKNAFLQQPRISAQGISQQVELSPGETTLIAGYEQSLGRYLNQRLDENAPIILGGSTEAEKSSAITLIYVTAIPEEGM